MARESVACAFCDTLSHDVGWMWRRESTGVAICDQCVVLCFKDALSRKRETTLAPAPDKPDLEEQGNG